MRLKKFNTFKINESNNISDDKIVLYRLTSHSVVDLNDPGEFYVAKEEDIDPSLLKSKGGDMFLLTVETESSNIDEEESEKESLVHDGKQIVVVKDSALCSVINVVPFEK